MRLEERWMKVACDLRTGTVVFREGVRIAHSDGNKPRASRSRDEADAEPEES
jgi:hypothetical protein